MLTFPTSVFPTSHAIRAGRDSDGCNIYVGRAFHENDLLPAKVIPDKQLAFVSFDGCEIPKTEFEVLRSGDFVWEFATNGDIPMNAMPIGQLKLFYSFEQNKIYHWLFLHQKKHAGKTIDGENLYMGRCLYEGTQTPGKIQPSHGCLYIPYNGEEISVREYEVLVFK